MGADCQRVHLRVNQDVKEALGSWEAQRLVGVP
jgi:hypothetical protein